jgi:hypothetical protein
MCVLNFEENKRLQEEEEKKKKKPRRRRNKNKMEDVSKGRKEKGALGGTCIPVYISSTLQAFHDWQHVDKFSG